MIGIFQAHVQRRLNKLFGVNATTLFILGVLIIQPPLLNQTCLEILRAVTTVLEFAKNLPIILHCNHFMEILKIPAKMI